MKSKYSNRSWKKWCELDSANRLISIPVRPICKAHLLRWPLRQSKAIKDKRNVRALLMEELVSTWLSSNNWISKVMAHMTFQKDIQTSLPPRSPITIFLQRFYLMKPNRAYMHRSTAHAKHLQKPSTHLNVFHFRFKFLTHVLNR